MTVRVPSRPGPHFKMKRAAMRALAGVAWGLAILSAALAIELWLARAFDDHLIATLFVLILAVVVLAFASPMLAPPRR